MSAPNPTLFRCASKQPDIFRTEWDDTQEKSVDYFQ